MPYRRFVCRKVTSAFDLELGHKLGPGHKRATEDVFPLVDRKDSLVTHSGCDTEAVWRNDGIAKTHLEVADGVGSILRRHDFGQTGGEVVAGAWARCTLAEAARVQISDANGDLASLAHPGDGMWRFLAVVGPFEGPVDVYLQVVRPGSATFGDVLTAPIAPAAWRHTGDDGELP